MNVLVVDDEASERKNMVNVLANVVPHALVDCVGNAREAMEKCRTRMYHVAFLDIEMPGKDGISLAKDILEQSPMTNIVMVTAYDQYAIDAHRLFVSGYILKPAMEDEVRVVLRNLRHPIDRLPEGLYVCCFGNFEVFYNGEIVKFHRTQAKEMLAYLIDRKGAGVTGEELRAILWEDAADDSEKQRDYLHKIWYDLRNTLADLGCGDVVRHTRNIYAVDPQKLHCDYYMAVIRNGGRLSGYRGEYMNQYSWAEESDIRG